jgi:thiol-disulfide isomerase/thioredoxin
MVLVVVLVLQLTPVMLRLNQVIQLNHLDHVQAHKVTAIQHVPHGVHKQLVVNPVVVYNFRGRILYSSPIFQSSIMEKKIRATRLKLFVIVAIIPLNILFAKDANNVFVEGTMNSTEFKEIIIRKLGVLKNDEIAEFRIPIVNHKFKGSFNIPSFGFYNIADGWGGHTIFVNPGDSIKFNLNIRPNLQATFHKKIYTPGFHILSTPQIGLWGNLLFFDKLVEKNIYSIKYNSSDPTHPTPTGYKQKCDKAREASILLLNHYKTRGIISKEFYKYALIEINCKYILWLCDILSQVAKDKIPDNYFENINKVDFKDQEPLYVNESFVTAATVYDIYYLNSFDYKKWYSNLQNEYNSALNFFSGLLRDKVLSELIVEYSDKNYVKFDSVYKRFKIDCNDLAIRRNTIKIVEKNLSKGKYDTKELASVLSSARIKDVEGKEFTLLNIFKSKKYIIIDCWATWCGPCIQQKPYLQAFEKKYNDSVYFIYLSADIDSTKWEKYVKTKKINGSNQFILTNSFKSLFATYFQIDAIPRYIFLKNEGREIISPAMPIPIMKDTFESIIQNEINKSVLL